MGGQKATPVVIVVAVLVLVAVVFGLYKRQYDNTGPTSDTSQVPSGVQPGDPPTRGGRGPGPARGN